MIDLKLRMVLHFANPIFQYLRSMFQLAWDALKSRACNRKRGEPPQSWFHTCSEPCTSRSLQGGEKEWWSFPQHDPIWQVWPLRDVSGKSRIKEQGVLKNMHLTQLAAENLLPHVPQKWVDFLGGTGRSPKNVTQFWATRVTTHGSSLNWGYISWRVGHILCYQCHRRSWGDLWVLESTVVVCKMSEGWCTSTE